MKVLKFGATWCGSCKSLESRITTWNNKIKDSLTAIDIDDQMDLAKQYKIKSLPTVVIVNSDGVEVDRMNGVALTEENILKHL